ncbi:heat shock factor binding protein 1 [Plectosphaerella cucumerina]|uniref:Heat shock factor binding protein 1 n=1 Tax=Plectosphaerella cucumerina TaxID=40658 RepID=A0A8K0TCW8_9PEZI|nr:heat shock factor binding protein 1 [Plectosphaerella cucumerina]
MASNEGDQSEVQKKDVTNAELQAAVDKLLVEVTTTFSSVSSDITAQLNAMTERLDRLEASVLAEKPKGDPPSQP